MREASAGPLRTLAQGLETIFHASDNPGMSASIESEATAMTRAKKRRVARAHPPRGESAAAGNCTRRIGAISEGHWRRCATAGARTAHAPAAAPATRGLGVGLTYRPVRGPLTRSAPGDGHARQSAVESLLSVCRWRLCEPGCVLGSFP